MIPILYAPVALPGSGKSTFINGCVDQGIFPASSVISTDVIRLALCGDISDQSRNTEVFAYAREAIEMTLMAGLDAFDDSTHLTAPSRTDVIEIARRAKADIVWIDLNVDYETACKRNAARPQPVPDDVMGRMNLLYSAVNWGDLARSGLLVDTAGAWEIMANDMDAFRLLNAVDESARL